MHCISYYATVNLSWLLSLRHCVLTGVYKVMQNTHQNRWAILLPFSLPANVAGNTFGRICLCVGPVRALPFENLDLETSFLVCKYIFRIPMPSSYVKIIGSRSRSQKQKTGFTSVNKYTHSRVVRLRLQRKSVYFVVSEIWNLLFRTSEYCFFLTLVF